MLPLELRMKMRSPGCFDVLAMCRTPAALYCAELLCGRRRPKRLKTYIVKPLQSNRLGPVAPYAYGWPWWRLASCTAAVPGLAAEAGLLVAPTSSVANREISRLSRAVLRTGFRRTRTGWVWACVGTDGPSRTPAR